MELAVQNKIIDLLQSTKKVTLQDFQKEVLADSQQEASRMFAEMVLSSDACSMTDKYFLATSLEYNFSKIVHEDELRNLISTSESIDSVHLMYIKMKENHDPGCPLNLDPSAYEHFPNTLEFNH